MSADGTRKRLSSSVGIVVLGIALVSVGVVLGAVLIPVQVPSQLSTSAKPVTVKVSSQELSDQSPVDLALGTSELAPIVTHAAGVVTQTTCTPGGVANSGTAAVTLDSETLVYLATAQPLWRDLALGDRGSDVTALQSELKRLGYAVSVSGRFDRAALKAAAALAAKAGNAGTGAWTSFPVDAFVWIPAEAQPLKACSAKLGSSVQVGDQLATLPDGLVSARVAILPTATVPGDRVVVVDGVTFPTDSMGAIPASSLPALAETASYLAFASGQSQAAQGATESGLGTGTSSSGSGNTISAVYQLAKPVSVVAVPPSALYDATTSDACVIGDGAPRRVEIVGSQLGESYVIPQGGGVLDRVTLMPRKTLSCR